MVGGSRSAAQRKVRRGRQGEKVAIPTAGDHRSGLPPACAPCSPNTSFPGNKAYLRGREIPAAYLGEGRSVSQGSPYGSGSILRVHPVEEDFRDMFFEDLERRSGEKSLKEPSGRSAARRIHVQGNPANLIIRLPCQCMSRRISLSVPTLELEPSARPSITPALAYTED